jgi:hypothetical protein
VCRPVHRVWIAVLAMAVLVTAAVFAAVVDSRTKVAAWVQMLLFR